MDQLPVRALDAEVEEAWDGAPRYEAEVYKEGMAQAVKDCELLLERCAAAQKASKRARVSLREHGAESVPFRKAVVSLEKAERRVARQARDASLVGACVRTALTQIMADHYETPEGNEGAKWSASLEHSAMVMETVHEAANGLIGRIRDAARLGQSK